MRSKKNVKLITSTFENAFLRFYRKTKGEVYTEQLNIMKLPKRRDFHLNKKNWKSKKCQMGMCCLDLYQKKKVVKEKEVHDTG